MPTYRFRCDNCGAVFEATQTVAEHENGWPECPKCHAEDSVERPATDDTARRKS